MTRLHKLATTILPCWLLLACNGHDEPATKAKDSRPAADTIAVFILKPDTLKKSIELPAELASYQHTDLYAKVQGFVKAMKVDIGARVRAGQTLAVIEAPEVNTHLEEANATLQSMKAKWAGSRDHYLRLYNASIAETPGIVAPVDLEHAKDVMLTDSAAYEASRKQVQANREISGYLYIVAPFSGVITARKADAGALVGTTTSLLTIQDDRTLRLRISVPESYTAAANFARPIHFRVDAWPDRSFTATPARKSSVINPDTRAELWEFEVKNDDQALKSGAFVFAQLKLERAGPSLLVPPSAVATTQEKKFVIRIKGNAVEWVDVGQGISTDKGVEIFGQLNPGDTLLVKATDERKPGTTGFWKIRGQ